jgi:hypothetical protein
MSSLKLTLLANVLLIIFPILFAITVCTSVYDENSKLTLKYTDSEEGCKSNMIINMSIAIGLAALWNSKRIIKIGAL